MIGGFGHTETSSNFRWIAVQHYYYYYSRAGQGRVGLYNTDDDEDEEEQEQLKNQSTTSPMVPLMLILNSCTFLRKHR